MNNITNKKNELQTWDQLFSSGDSTPHNDTIDNDSNKYPEESLNEILGNTPLKNLLGYNKNYLLYLLKLLRHLSLYRINKIDPSQIPHNSNNVKTQKPTISFKKTLEKNRLHGLYHYIGSKPALKNAIEYAIVIMTIIMGAVSIYSMGKSIYNTIQNKQAKQASHEVSTEASTEGITEIEKIVNEALASESTTQEEAQEQETSQTVSEKTSNYGLYKYLLALQIEKEYGKKLPGEIHILQNDVTLSAADGTYYLTQDNNDKYRNRDEYSVSSGEETLIYIGDDPTKEGADTELVGLFYTNTNGEYISVENHSSPQSYLGSICENALKASYKEFEASFHLDEDLSDAFYTSQPELSKKMQDDFLKRLEEKFGVEITKSIKNFIVNLGEYGSYNIYQIDKNSLELSIPNSTGVQDSEYSDGEQDL